MYLPFLVALIVSSASCVRTNYDFIVVGAGTGGSVVARRLAENGKFTVLLVEAGGPPPNEYEVPAFAQKFFSDSYASQYAFRYKSVPQTHAALIKNGTLNLLMGRMLGGTSSLNGMVFNRGSPYDWDNYANVTGDPTWSYENMLPYMKKLENYQGDFPSDQHGTEGPLTISRPKYSPGLKDFWLAAGQELGYPIGDPNGPQMKGFSAYEYTKKHGRRVNSYDSYVKPFLGSNRNLDVLPNTNVTEIVVLGGRAVAVRTQPKSSVFSPDALIFAKKEIIISAGVYNSPLILQRSGIGPKNVLSIANVPVLKELPVGSNLHDQPITGLHFAINNNSAGIVFDEDRDFNEETWQLFEEFGDGPYTTNRASTGQSFMVSSIESNPNWPDIQLCMAHSVKPWVAVTGMQSDSKNLAPGESSIFMYMFLGRPKSRGSIQIDPKDKYGNAIIDLGFLTDSRDLQMFVEGLKEIVKIAEETEAYGKLGARLLPPSVPACQEFPLKSDSFWRCYITQTLQTGAHPVGSVKMGRKDDPTSVVDPELRVIGVDGLRVVDASIMPFVTNTNTQAPVYAIAEKASDMILKSWKNSI